MPEESSVDPMLWVDRHGDALFRFALLRVRDRTVAEDLVQEALLAAIQSSGALADAGKERAWLIGILRHKVIDHFRRTARDGRVSDRQAVDELANADQDFDERGHWAAPPGDWDSPDRLLEREEFMAAFVGCLGALPERLKSTFALRELDGTGCDDLADILGTSKNNVWVLLSRARRRLRDCLERHWFRQ